jgi:transposase
LIDIEHKDWARRMRTLLRCGCHAANLARKLGKPVPPRLIALIERCYDSIVADGMAWHESPTCCASCPTLPCRSPTIWPNAMRG